MGLFGIKEALLLVILKIAFATLEESCLKIDTCSCKLTNGSTVQFKGGGWRFDTEVCICVDSYGYLKVLYCELKCRLVFLWPFM